MAKCYEVPPLKSKKEWGEYLDSPAAWAYSYAPRKNYIKKHSWSILTTEVAHHLGKFLSMFDLVIEPFAGTGYLAHHLREASGLGKRYRAYDACLSHWDETERPNYGFTKSGVFNTNIKKAGCVVMSWPNYNQNLAYRIARKMVSGQYLVYQGEGWSGCTANDEFHQHLDDAFEVVSGRSFLVDQHGHRWPGMYDTWTIYRKK